MPPTTMRDPAEGWTDIVTNQALPARVRAIYVGVTGDIMAVDQGGNKCLFKAVPVGVLLIRPTMIMTTGTTATNMVALF